MRTEFYDIAARAGFYGIDRSGLTGKKDNVRKYWEDMSLKLALRPVLLKLRQRRPRLRVVDLGCGAGEGVELLTHIPEFPRGPETQREFLLSIDDFEWYVGLDISEGMVAQGAENYRGRERIHFRQADLSAGYPLLSEPPPDVVFSSYGSLSHLSADALERLLRQVFGQVEDGAVVVFDMLGRYSPEWPGYWSHTSREMLPYNMVYLLPEEERRAERVEQFVNSFWTPAELRASIRVSAAGAGRQVRELAMYDRSIFVGRHMDTGYFNGNPRPWRMQVNRLLDHGYRGQLEQLRVDLEWLSPHLEERAEVRACLERYAGAWNCVLDLIDALMREDAFAVRRLIEGAAGEVSDELKVLAWLARNGTRFPVADFWASVVGPQVAVILRNFESTLSPPTGCGHGLVCIVEASS